MQNQKIQIFDGQKVRTAWNEEEEKWYFSIVDVCWILTGQPDLEHARNYWKVLKHRLVAEGFELVTNCNQLKMVSPKTIYHRLMRQRKKRIDLWKPQNLD